jgi:hypothetical protein
VAIEAGLSNLVPKLITFSSHFSPHSVQLFVIYGAYH